ncbi:MAG: hypothetical protein K2V38_01945 [Gemmataceae bacterium]|nr:hypothetical protein [Gemmataceae bacterium]
MARFAGIQAEYREASPYPGYSKYLDIEPVMRRALYSAYELGLHRSPPLRVLDLGTGCGYFPYICKYFGHTAVAVDLDEVPMYREVVDCLGVDRRVCRISAFERLPDIGPRFDVVTALAVCFNNHDQPDLWGPDEWLFFLKDLADNQLTAGGRLLMKLNQESDGSYADERLSAFFRRCGATVAGERVYFASLAQLPST